MANRDYSSEYRKRTGTRTIRSRSDYERLKPRERTARHKAFDAIALMRSDNLSLRAAAHRADTTPETVRRYAGDLLERHGNRYVAKKSDRSYHRMAVLSTTGVVEIDVRGSRARSQVARHWNAIRRFAGTGDLQPLLAFKGVRVGGVELATDPDAIEEYLRRGEIDIDDIYVTSI